MKKVIENKEKIKALIQEYQEKGGDDVFCKLIKETKVLRQYAINKIQRPKSITNRELEQECNIALYKVATLYDTTKDGKVTNYIINAMERAMIHYIRNEQNIIYISNNRHYKNATIRKFIAEYMSEYGETPADDIILATLKDKHIYEADVFEYHKTSAMGTYTNIDDIEYAVEDTFEEEEEEQQELAKELLEIAKPHEQELLKMIYYENKSYSDVARELKCSRENIRQKHDRAINRIKKHLEKRKDK